MPYELSVANGHTRRALRRLRGGVAAIALLAFAGAASAQDADGRVVIALSPVSAETNLFWQTDGDLGLHPALQGLVGSDPVTGEYTNDALAESWEANEDFTEWTFHLRENVPWHFGYGDVTVADVVHSYQLHTGEDASIAGLDQMRGAEVEALDDHTVRFTFPDPRTNFLFALAGRGILLIYSKEQFDQEGLDGYHQRPAGTGHYQYVERRPGESVLFERVEDHWSGQDAGFAELQMRWSAEPTTKLALLLSGEAHIADIPRELQEQVLSQGMEIIASHGPAMQTFMLFNGLYEAEEPQSVLPWSDVRVREAINRSINRDELLEVLYEGRASKLPQVAMDPRHEGYDPSIEAEFEENYGFDPERARELLAEAGYPDAFSEPVVPIASTVLPGNPEFGTLAEMLQLYFEGVGLQTEIRQMDMASLAAVGRAREAYLLNPLRNAPVRPTEVGLVNFYTPDGTPYAGFHHEAVEELIAELRTTINPDERHEIAAEAFNLLNDMYSDIPIATISAEAVVNPEVVGSWDFPGVASIGFSHWNLIMPANGD